MATAAQQTQAHALSAKLVYLFGDGRSEAAADARNLLGGKGAGLAEMSSLGIPVPPGFTITTEVCNEFYVLGRRYPDALEAQVREGVAHIERVVGTRFGDPENPLLVSVRSGARVSMPGMMDTVLNLGLNDATAEGLARRSGNARFAYDSYRRFVAMYGDVVLGMERDGETDADPFEALLEAKKHSRGVELDTELDAEALRELVVEYKATIRDQLGVVFPDDPWEQLWGAVGAVFNSWQNPRAVVYRERYRYPADWGTAVNVQAMVFGNLGDDCATGVVFTRNAATGASGLTGEYLVNAQGEDVVAGTRTPQPVRSMAKQNGAHNGAGPSLEELMPVAYASLLAACERLERHFGDMQDIEFTVQQSRLWILQTRNGKRTGQAMVKIAHDMVAEGLIDKRAALRRQDPEQLDELLHPVFDPKAPREVIATGLAASPGAAVGRVVFSAEEAYDWAERGEAVILVRTETSPEDIQGMIAARGILTARGGMTSHAAVVARGMGKCCVSGCSSIDVDYARGQFVIDRLVVRRGDVIALDGSTGEVMLGALPLLDPELPAEYQTLMGWADEVRSLKIRANADTPEDAARARAFGAEGIGLCRTEHMFFEAERILAVRQMLLADDKAGRRAALAKILPMQREDFIGILRAMAGLPVTIRLLDPPLHEFLPKREQTAEVEDVARALGVTVEHVLSRVEGLAEANPMLGHRGVRLAVTFPEIAEIQVRAVIEAACILTKEGLEVLPEIMVPIVGIEGEIERLRAEIVAVAERVIEEQGVRPHYSVGTMIELPRACVIADKIAKHADFFSFGTNDLTQTTFGLSRDDAGRFLPAYIEKGLLARDPFVELDVQGVGALMRMGVERGRSVKPDLKVGICGEHGGEPRSIGFCHQAGFNYVSCSPYRVPIARLAAAQAALDVVAAAVD